MSWVAGQLQKSNYSFVFMQLSYDKLQRSPKFSFMHEKYCNVSLRFPDLLAMAWVTTLSVASLHRTQVSYRFAARFSSGKHPIVLNSFARHKLPKAFIFPPSGRRRLDVQPRDASS